MITFYYLRQNSVIIRNGYENWARGKAMTAEKTAFYKYCIQVNLTLIENVRSLKTDTFLATKLFVMHFTEDISLFSAKDHAIFYIFFRIVLVLSTICECVKCQEKEKTFKIVANINLSVQLND